MSTIVIMMVYSLFIWSLSSLGMLVVYYMAHRRYMQLTGFITPRLNDVYKTSIIIAIMPVLNTLAFVLTIYFVIKDRHVIDRRLILLLSKPLADQNSEFSSSFFQ